MRVIYGDVMRAAMGGTAIAVIFNRAAAALAFINPRYFFDSYPKVIQVLIVGLLER